MIRIKEEVSENLLLQYACGWIFSARYMFRKAVVKSYPKFKDSNNAFQVTLKEATLSEENITLPILK